MRLLERIVEKPHPCAYLPAQSASLEVRVMLDVTGRRDGRHARDAAGGGSDRSTSGPACASCTECVSLRVVTDRFAPSKSQRRAARACSRLRRVVGPAARRRRAPRALCQVARRARRRARLGAQRADRGALLARVRVPPPLRPRGRVLRRRRAAGRARGHRPLRRRRRAPSRRRSSSTTPTTRGCRSGRANILSLIEDARVSAPAARVPRVSRRGVRVAPLQGRLPAARAPARAAGVA